MEGRNLIQIIKDFLLSNLNKQFLTFLFFILLSAVFWFILTLNDNYEKEMKIPVHIVNIPRNVMLTSASIDTVRATVHGQGWTLLNYLYGEHNHSINVDFRNYDKGNGKGSIPASDLKRAIEQRFELSSKITSVKPEKLEFFYNNGERKRVPIHWTGRVIPEQLYFISHVAYKPDSVDVYASREKLDSIRMIYSEPLNYVGFRDTLEVLCKLAHPADVKVVPERVKIVFHTDVLTEESIEVPIKCVNLPAGKTLRTFPSKVRVNFVAGISQIRSLSPDEFSVVADYLEIQQKPSDKCNLYLQSVPHGINRATLSVKQVDYLIEEEGN
ncbi:MAG: YbbR-like domain-containing protein [Prevotella sp.]|nr:YbbR-like domain-containing protein [Prevotella sp.]